MPAISDEERTRRLDEYAYAMSRAQYVGGRPIAAALLDWANYTSGRIDAAERDRLARDRLGLKI